MKKFLVIAMAFCAVSAFARPVYGKYHGRNHLPPSYQRGNDGVWLAAGIIGIVANSINILNAVTTPRYVVPAPVSASPVIVPQTVYPQVVPATQVVYSQPAGVPANRYNEQKVPIVQTVLVPIQINGQTIYRQEQRIIYIKQGK